MYVWQGLMFHAKIAQPWLVDLFNTVRRFGMMIYIRVYFMCSVFLLLLFYLGRYKVSVFKVIFLYISYMFHLSLCSTLIDDIMILNDFYFVKLINHNVFLSLFLKRRRRRPLNTDLCVLPLRSV